jgi:RNA polymerase sigma-70 factor (ECF subfamily)
VEKSAFINLLTNDYCRLHSFVLCMVPNKADADDVMQETTLLMWEKFNEFEPGTEFYAWAKAIARYRILNLRKKQATSHCQLNDNVLELLEHDRDSYQDQADKKLDALRNCLKKLSDDHRTILQFKYSAGIPAKLIAKRTGIPLHTLYRKITNVHAVLLSCVRRELKFKEASA